MSISQSLNNAVSGLAATSRMAEVVSSNLSNALTEGYGRRVLDVSSQTVGGSSAGVQIDGITRIVDRGLIGDRRSADAALSFQSGQAQVYARLVDSFSPPNDPAGLAGRVTALEQALITAGGDPSSDRNLGAVLSRLQDVAQHLNQNARDVQAMRQDADAAIARDVDTLNNALMRVQQINSDITRARATGTDTSALLDARRLAIDTIAGIVPVREIDRPNEAVALMTPTGLLLVDGPAKQFGFEQTPTITADMTLASGGVKGITLDGVPLGTTDGFGKLSGGSLEASFVSRDDTLVSAQTALDQIAADLIDRFSDPAVDPTLGVGDPGLLTDAGGPMDPTDIVDLSRRISVNGNVDPAAGGALFRIRDGVNAVAPGPVGDSSQINRLTEVLGISRSISAAISPRSAVGQVAAVAELFATQRTMNDERVTFATARRDTLLQAELGMGVDSDQELQSLLKIEQAYAANARLMQTINAMIQTLMEI